MKDTVLGHYRIIELLGKGGMGEVYVGEDTRLGRRVAVKILSRDLGLSSDQRERFEREARAVAALNHPNIVTIHSVEEAGGVAPHCGDGNDAAVGRRKPMSSSSMSKAARKRPSDGIHGATSRMSRGSLTAGRC